MRDYFGVNWHYKAMTSVASVSRVYDKSKLGVSCESGQNLIRMRHLEFQVMPFAVLAWIAAYLSDSDFDPRAYF